MAPLEEYHQLVREAILRRTGKPILNGNIDHATIITQECFNSASERVRILSSRLDPACYAQQGVIDAARVFLADPDHRAEILVESELWDTKGKFEWEKHPLLAALKDESDRLEVRLVPKDWIERYGFNFLTMDDYGYRFESDRSRAAAVAVFLPESAPKTQVENLNRIFSELWEVSQTFERS